MCCTLNGLHRGPSHQKFHILPKSTNALLKSKIEMHFCSITCHIGILSRGAGYRLLLLLLHPSVWILTYLRILMIGLDSTKHAISTATFTVRWTCSTLTPFQVWPSTVEKYHELKYSPRRPRLTPLLPRSSTEMLTPGDHTTFSGPGSMICFYFEHLVSHHT